jgi:Putative adhesin
MAVSTPRLVVLVGAVLLALCVVAFAATEAATKDQTTTRTISGRVERVLIHADAGDVRLVGSTGSQVTVRTERRWLWRKPTVRATRRGELLELRGDCPHGTFMDRCSADFEVEVPFAVDVQVDGDAGDLKIDDIAGNLRMKTNAGDISGSGLQPATVRAHTDAGDIDLAFDTSPALVDAFSDAGDVALTVPAGEYHIDTAAGSGDVTLDGVLRNDRAVRRIVAETKAGDVSVRGRG